MFYFPFVTFFAAVPMKVKKTDLPVLPPESEILPSLDDSEDNLSDDIEDEDIEDEDEMMADEPLENLEEEEEDEDDYESEEDQPSAIDQDFINDNGNNYNNYNWDPIINTSKIVINKEVPLTSTAAPTTASTTAKLPSDFIAITTTPSSEKATEIPISQPSVNINDGAGTAIPTPDPYFTHFDPRQEHQSYKVGLDVKNHIF